MQCLITVIVVVILLVSGTSSWPHDVCDHIDTSNGTHENYSSRELDSIPTDLPNNTFKLELQNNNISVIENNTFNNLPSLSWLNLDNNSIAVIDDNTFNNLPNLQFLSLRGNKIASIKSDTFNNLPKLCRLWLQYNDISQIDDNTFNNLPSLQELIMNNNSISFVSENAFEDLPKLESLEFDMHCGACGNIPFWNWLKSPQRFSTSIICNDFDGEYLSFLQPNKEVTACFEKPSNSANDGNGLVWCSFHSDWKSLVYTFCMISLQYMMSNI